MDTETLTDAIKARSRELGFDAVGICPAAAPAGLARFHQWLQAGYAGQMHYLPERAGAYEHPRHVLDGVRSIVMLALNYRTRRPAPAAPGTGRVSTYAWGATDYHDLIRDRLAGLAGTIREHRAQARTRGVVDTAPLMERELAQRAGLGWIGKNTLLLNRRAGSWFFLAALLTNVPLQYDTPYAADHCGTCRACLDACPTGAFPQPRVLDASRCISYLTIELQGPIPPAFRGPLGDRLFGCDICQEVCPWNRHVQGTSTGPFVPANDMNPADLVALFALSDEAFRCRFRHTALWRPRRQGILRNAAIVLGNHPTPVALPALIHGLDDHAPLVRGACAWALGRYPQPAARAALTERRAVESDPVVRHEIDTALG